MPNEERVFGLGINTCFLLNMISSNALSMQKEAIINDKSYATGNVDAYALSFWGKHIHSPFYLILNSYLFLPFSSHSKRWKIECFMTFVKLIVGGWKDVKISQMIFYISFRRICEREAEKGLR